MFMFDRNYGPMKFWNNRDVFPLVLFPDRVPRKFIIMDVLYLISNNSVNLQCLEFKASEIQKMAWMSLLGFDILGPIGLIE